MRGWCQTHFRCAIIRKRELSDSIHRRQEADSGANHGSASLPRRLRRLRELVNSPYGLVQKQFPILTSLHPHPGPLPSDGRGRIVRHRSADPTILGTADDRSGCSLSRRTGEGQGEGRFVSTAPLFRKLFLHEPLSRNNSVERDSNHGWTRIRNVLPQR